MARNGCRVHHDCLECPLAVCVDDLDPDEARAARKKYADLALKVQVTGLMDQGMSLREAVTTTADRMGHQNTSSIYRRLKRN